MKLRITPGAQLSVRDAKLINKAKHREFRVSPIDQSQLRNSIFFLLKDGSVLKATGQLIEIKGIKIGTDVYDVLGIGGIVSNEKFKGYGRKVMNAIKKYLEENKITGVGFCQNHNRDFYLKCGISVDCQLISRFIYFEGKKPITNTDDDCVIYYETGKKLVSNLQNNKKEIARLPRRPDW